MTASAFHLKKVTNQYKETLTVLEIVGNSVRVLEEYSTQYHTSKLFYEGASLYTLING
ncbi:hypothetical protein [Rufibacter immobilis]|uniref:hypothetical protein n=1 Tax=Rufibacter immobilis TaxID=1348778 RepID=UPI00160A7927|nr:hypothetical protein [Rufibacter immobilis]